MKYILLLLAVVAVGCYSTVDYLDNIGKSKEPTSWELAEMWVNKNHANMANLSIGMNEAQVIEVMGLAGKTEGYETESGGFMKFLFYRSKVGYANRRYDPYELWTPVCLIDDKLKGWGRNFYDDTIKIRKEIIRK